MTSQTLYEKIWDAHLVHEQAGQPSLIYIDRHLIHEGTSPQAFAGIKAAGRTVRRPELTFAVMDHSVSTKNRALPVLDPDAAGQFEALARNCNEFGVNLFDMHSRNQGIVHVIGPELGITQPGFTIVCGDSHTSTHGAFGALAFGIGTSEIEHVLATQCLSQFKSKTMLMQVDVRGKRPNGVTAKDIILAIIGKIGIAGGNGHVVEYAGEAVRGLSMEGRMTMCNMTIEGGARAGMVAPDETTFAYMEGRPFVPRGKDFQIAVDYWKSLATDPGAQYDETITLHAEELAPMVTWGTNPGHGDAGNEPRARSAFLQGSRRPESRRARPRIHGARAGHADARHLRRSRLHWLLHEFAPRRLARRRESRRRQARREIAEAGARGSGLAPRESRSRKRRPRQNLPRRRIRVARRRLQHVHRHE